MSYSCWDRQRSFVLVTLWVFILGLGLPWWYFTTKVERLPLDREGIARWSNAYKTERQTANENEIDYSRQVNIVVTLLHQDSTQSGFVDWDMDLITLLQIEPFLERFDGVHNFTVSFQTRPFAPVPATVQRSIETLGYVPKGDLGVFVNPSGWNLEDHNSLNPTLQLVGFIPVRPLHVERKHASREGSLYAEMSADSILVPQWGGVVLMHAKEDEQDSVHVHKEEARVLGRIFRSQIASLLGVSGSTGWVSDEHRDALVQHRISQTSSLTAATLVAADDIIQQQQNIPVGLAVQSLITKSIALLEEADAVATSDAMGALSLFARAYEHALEALDHPTMLGSQYFPSEHVYAVYMPLFGPITLPLLATTIAMVKQCKAKRAAQAKNGKSE